MSDRRSRLDTIRERARQRAGSDRPDTPEEAAERSAITRAIMPLQLAAMASLDDEGDHHQHEEGRPGWNY